MSFDRSKLEALGFTSGLEYTAEFVPYSQVTHRDGHDGKRWECINWRITLKRNGVTLETEYAQGIGHLPSHVQGRSIDSNAAMRRVLESGRTRGKIPPPDLADVLYGLVLDGCSALDSPSYEDFAAEFGMDPDSRKGEQTYRTCLEHGLKLRAMFGETDLAELRELFSDY